TPDRRRRATARGRRRWSCSRAEASIRHDARRLAGGTGKARDGVWARFVILPVHGSRFTVHRFMVHGSRFKVRSFAARLAAPYEPAWNREPVNREPVRTVR